MSSIIKRMKKTKFIFLGLLISLTATFYSCEKEDGGEKQTYSILGTSWIYSDAESGGKNTFEFTDEQSVSFTQDWVDTGVEYTETQDGTYSYNHPSVSITVGSKEYDGIIDGESMIIGGFVYKKQ